MLILLQAMASQAIIQYFKHMAAIVAPLIIATVS